MHTHATSPAWDLISRAKRLQSRAESPRLGTPIPFRTKAEALKSAREMRTAGEALLRAEEGATIAARPLSRYADLTAKLAEVNGRRRERVLDATDLDQALYEALTMDEGSRDGGRCWANAYRYPAVRTAILTRAYGTRIAIDIDRRNAGKGAALGELRINYALVITRREAVRVTHDRLAAARVEAATVADLGVPPSTVITYADSIAAGNCARVTRRVKTMLEGAESVTADRLLLTLKRRAPHLVRYAARAAAVAAKRAEAEGV